ncbi:MAG TPA: hypothetical protein VGH60_08790 [Solirubrobacteraceae bacterium]|jgi:hypothetical protein
MKPFLSSLRSDLLDRRFLPVLVVLGVAFVAALAFAVVGGGSSTSSTPPATSASTGVTGRAGVVAITPAPAANEAVAETTSGAHQHSGAPRNPFTPLPSSAKAKTATASAPSSSSASGSSSGSSKPSSSSGSSTGAGGSSPSTPSKSTKPKPKPAQQIYHVDVLFGAAPVGTPPQSIPLTAFNNLTRLYPLAVSGEAPLVFTGVTAGGASAIFTIVREVFPHGPAVCHPSASQCQAIQLKPGQSEELEYIPTTGQALVYRLELVSIAAAKAAAAKAASAFHTTSPAGRALLRSAGLSTLSGLRYSTNTGVIVLRTHRSFAAHAASHHR